MSLASIQQLGRRRWTRLLPLTPDGVRHCLVPFSAPLGDGLLSRSVAHGGCLISNPLACPTPPGGFGANPREARPARVSSRDETDLGLLLTQHPVPTAADHEKPKGERAVGIVTDTTTVHTNHRATLPPARSFDPRRAPVPALAYAAIHSSSSAWHHIAFIIRPELYELYELYEPSHTHHSHTTSNANPIPRPAPPTNHHP